MKYTEISEPDGACIKVVGIGNCGINAVNRMIASGLSGVTFIAADTDKKALAESRAEHTILLGTTCCTGLGTGSDFDAGRQAAEESLPAIKDAIDKADLVFVVAGMGGGTGSGVAPVIAKAASGIGTLLTVGVVTTPFSFEGKKRLTAAETGISELREHTNSLIIIPNDNLISLSPQKATFAEMLKIGDEKLYTAVRSLSDPITKQGLICLDFADVMSVMHAPGFSIMADGRARGEFRARDAAMMALTSPILRGYSVRNAYGAFLAISCGSDVTIDEIGEAACILQKEFHEDARVFFGALIDDAVGDEFCITVIISGVDQLTISSRALQLSNSIEIV